MPNDQDLPDQKPIKNAPKAADLVAKALAQPSTESQPISQPTKLPDRLLERLWMKMAEMYGHRWTSSFGDNPNPDSAWSTVLQGLTGQQLANGLNLLVHKGDEFDWPPPANVFRSLCLHVPGLPPESEAWIEALKGTYSHEAVQVAAQMTGTYELRRATQADKSLRLQFERHYAIVIRRIQNGQPLDGRVAIGIGHDSQKSEAERAEEYAEQQLHERIVQQGIPTNGKSARELLLANLGIRRDTHA